MSAEEILKTLHSEITTHVIIRESGGAFIADPLVGEGLRWIFDFRTLLLNGVFLDLVADFFWHTYEKKYPFQIGGLETASIPLIAAIVLKGYGRGMPVNGFYMRKSRKPEGLQKIIEGKITDDPIILIDDLINNGTTFIKQLAILEKEKKTPSDIFTLVRFRNLQDYTFAKEKNITVTAPFTLADFNLTLGDVSPPPKYDIFKTLWATHYGKPNYFYRVPKSAPVIDKKNLYVGGDDGIMRALSQQDGSPIWAYKIFGFGAQGKTIFSSPVLFGKNLYFGAYDGNFYALDVTTGKKKWIYMDADWIGSSPCVAEDLRLVYVGLEYGLWKKRGGIVALDAETGKKKWEYIDMPEYTHCSPVYSKKFGVVAIGSNDGGLYAFNAQTGQLLWKTNVAGEIKSAPAFDEKRGYIFFGSFDGGIYVVKVHTGELARVHQTGAAIYSTPLVTDEHVYISSLDKRVYCINLDTFEMTWVFATSGRIFASPVVIDRYVYIGSNDGRLYKIHATTGEYEGFFQTAERITNKIAYNKDTGRFFVPTYANEIYCLEKK